MIGFVRGTVHAYSLDYVLIDVNGIGYRINFYHPEALSLGKEVTVYTYQNVREDEISLFGFLSLQEYDLFVKLISVKGLGPKMALPMLATGSIEGIVDAIDRENILYLKKFPKIGDKVARQIILDLKGKLTSSTNNMIVNDSSDELTDALVALGYKQADIKKIVKNVSPDLTIENQIKEALKLLLK